MPVDYTDVGTARSDEKQRRPVITKRPPISKVSALAAVVAMAEKSE